MGYYKLWHYNPPLPKNTHHHSPPRKINPSRPTTSQNKPTTRSKSTTTHHYPKKPTTTHHHPLPPKIYSPPPTTTHYHPKYIHHHPNIHTITNTTQIKNPKYPKTAPKINLYYLPLCITIWKINWMLNRDIGIKRFL